MNARLYYCPRCGEHYCEDKTCPRCGERGYLA